MLRKTRSTGQSAGRRCLGTFMWVNQQVRIKVYLFDPILRLGVQHNNFTGKALNGIIHPSHGSTPASCRERGGEGYKGFCH